MYLRSLQLPAIWMVFRTSGEEQKKAIRDSLEMLETIEEHALGDKTFFRGDKIDLVDIAFGQLSQWLQMVEDTTNVKLLEASKFPRLQRWINNFKQVPIIKENLPDYQEMFAYFKALREMLLSSK